jgi:hypothetical protein
MSMVSRDDLAKQIKQAVTLTKAMEQIIEIDTRIYEKNVERYRTLHILLVTQLVSYPLPGVPLGG